MNILQVKRRCIELLERVSREGAYVHLVLQQEAERARRTPEEFPIITQLVRGVLEQRGVLEAMLESLLPRGLASLPERVQMVLLLATYQIAFLERVKKRDVVFEAVELVKEGKWNGFAGLINAVLRKVEPLSAGDCGARALENFPLWLVERWQKQCGKDEVRHFCEAAGKPLPVYLRINTQKVSAEKLQEELRHEGVLSERVSWCRVSLRVSSLPASKRLHDLDAYQRGEFYIQDLSSTLVSEIVASSSPQKVWDICAAPGGKACSIALSIAAFGGKVIASDRSSSRVMLIEQLARRLGVTNVVCHAEDALKSSSEVRGLFDVVLVDAPCSGFGTVGRKIDVRWSKSPEAITQLVEIQGALLERASASVSPGGALVYSTCSIDRGENEDVVQTFLLRHPEFYGAPLEDILPPELVTSEGFYRAWPHRHQMAGAFAARLVKRV